MPTVWAWQSSQTVWCTSRVKKPVLCLKGPASSGKVRMWPVLANYQDWKHPHSDPTNSTHTWRGSTVCRVRYQVPVHLGQIQTRKDLGGMWNVCVCARANGCVCAHLQTQVYVGINIGWKIWLFICIFFFSLNWILWLCKVWERRTSVLASCRQLSFTFVICRLP